MYSRVQVPVGQLAFRSQKGGIPSYRQRLSADEVVSFSSMLEPCVAGPHLRGGGPGRRHPGSSWAFLSLFEDRRL